MSTESTETNLSLLRLHLERVTRVSRSHGGAGWTYDEEIVQLGEAVAEIMSLRNGLSRSAQVIEAGEKERRALTVQLATLEAERAATPCCLSAYGRGFVVLSATDVARLKVLLGTCAAAEFSEEGIALLESKEGK